MEDTLYHYGVKGMRWGHHKRKEKTSRKDRIARAKKGMSKDNFDRYRKGGLIPNDMRAVRVYERSKKKGISYDKSDRRESIRDLAGIEAYTAAWALYYTAPLLKAIAHNKAAKIRYNRGKQYAQRNLARLPASATVYDYVTSVGGVDILEKFKP